MQKRLILNLIFILILFQSLFGDLIITKSVNKTAASPGATLTYNIFVQNTGSGALTGVKMWDTIPGRTNFVTSSAGTLNSGVLEYNIGSINAGDAVSVTLTVYVDWVLNTFTANIRNTAFVEADTIGVKESFPVFTTVVRSFSSSNQYVTYGAWEDFIKKDMGFIHIYTLADDCNLNLYFADDVLQTMNNLAGNWTGISAGRVIDFPGDNPTFNNQTGDCAVSNGLNQVGSHYVNTRYFKLASTKPFLWVFDSIIDDLWSDSFIFLMSTDYSFTGSAFFAHLYADRNPGYTYHLTDKHFGDGLAVINTNNFDIAAYVYFSNDNGANWAFKVSATVKPEDPSHTDNSSGGIWFYGGTTQSEEGDYKVIIRQIDSSGNDLGDARAILWKGNIFAGNSRPCTDCSGGAACSTGDRDSDHDNANAFAISRDGNKVSKAGFDVLYGCIAAAPESLGRSEVVITNVGSTPANISLYRYKNTAGFWDPVNDTINPNDDDFGTQGTWVKWGSDITNLAPDTSITRTAGTILFSGGEYGSYIKIVLTSGGPIQAITGTSIFNAHYGQADFLEAADTNISTGKEFWFGNSPYTVARSYDGCNGLKKADWWKDNRGGIFVALCPIPNTTVRIVQGSLIDLWGSDYGPSCTDDVIYHGSTALIQTTTGPDQALKFYSIDRAQTYKIVADNPIYFMIQNLKGREKIYSGVVVGVEYFYPEATLSKNSNVTTAMTGQTINYTITFQNTGAGDATDVEIIDTIPAGLNYISSSPSGTHLGGGVYQWNIGFVGAGAISSINITAQVTATGGNITNTATVYYKDSDGNTLTPKTSNENIITIAQPTPTRTVTPSPTFTRTVTLTPTHTPYPVLVLTKVATPSSAKMGEEVTFLINYRNTGSSPANNVVISDILSSLLICPTPCTTFTSTGSGTLIGNTITWNIGTVNPGASGSVSLSFIVPGYFLDDTTIQNAAMITSSEILTPVVSNNASLLVDVPELRLTPITNYPNPFTSETIILFELSIKADITVKFYTLSGELIKTMDEAEVKNNLVGQTDIQAGENRIRWDGTNKSGEKVSSGIYFYRVIAKKGKEQAEFISKLAVMR
jgi:uncharacterized repeat protein (TIGR01451 family)